MAGNHGEFTISTDKDRLDLGLIHSFLVEESYWARERTLEQTQTAIENSMCFGVFDGERQIAFARVVSDKATFAYVGDVFVVEEYRSRGISKMLMQHIVEHPELQGLRRWVLGPATPTGFTNNSNSHRSAILNAGWKRPPRTPTKKPLVKARRNPI